MVWYHRSGKGPYTITDITVRETDLAPWVSYREHNRDHGTVFGRPASEFFDGRFMCWEAYQNLKDQAYIDRGERPPPRP